MLQKAGHSMSVPVPTISSATYNASSGVLAVTGTETDLVLDTSDTPDLSSVLDDSGDQTDVLPDDNEQAAQQIDEDSGAFEPAGPEAAAAHGRGEGHEAFWVPTGHADHHIQYHHA